MLKNPVRIRLLRDCIVGGLEGHVGDIFTVSPRDAAFLVGDRMAELVDPKPAPYTVTIEKAEYGDPVAQRISPAPVLKNKSK